MPTAWRTNRSPEADTPGHVDGDSIAAHAFSPADAFPAPDDRIPPTDEGDLDWHFRWRDYLDLPLFQSPWVMLALLVAIGLAIRYILAPLGRMPFDFIVWASWSYTLTNVPLASFYSTAYEPLHLPGDLWFLWFIAQAYAAVTPGVDFNADTYLLYLKSVPFLADTGIAIMLFMMGARLGKTRLGLCAAAVSFLNPATMFISATWGQWDALPCFFALAAIVALFNGRIALSIPSLALACLIKPQFLLLLPIVLIYAARRYGLRSAVPSLMLGGVVSGVMVSLLLLPFSVSIWFLTTRWTLWDRVSFALEWWPLTTVRAANMWILSPGNDIARPDSLTWGFLTYQQLGQVLVLACCALVLLVLARCRLEELDTMTLWAAYCTMFAWFMFATRVHERYLFPAVVFLTALVLYTRIAAVVLAVLSITFLANLVWVYDLENTGMDWAWLNTDPAVRMIAAINLVLLAVSLFIPFVHRFTRGRSRTALSATRRVNVRRRATVTRRAPGPRWRELH